MHTKLLNIGFVRLPDGSYANYEINLVVRVGDDDTIIINTPDGDISATLQELEDAIIGGGFGDL
jgi:hypothetical protein